jgi:hypothetical protein
MNTNAVDSPSSGQSLAFEISGSGLIPQDTPAQQGNSRQDNRPGGGLGVPNEQPNPISSGQWAFLGVMTLFMAAGAAFIFMQTERTPVAQAVSASASSRGGGGSLLDALKEEMFQLEADRVQNKVSQQDYEAAKGVLDKTLQRAMKRN